MTSRTSAPRACRAPTSPPPSAPTRSRTRSPTPPPAASPPTGTGCAPAASAP
ncbi:glycoside hydrolase, partial [Streptomyces albidoflavus]